MTSPSLHGSLRFAVVLSATGGCLDAYSYLNSGVFAGAQTGNLTLSMLHLAAREWGEALRAGLPIAMYAGGSAIGAGLGLDHGRNVVRRPIRAALTIEAVLLVLAGVPPISGSPVAITILLALAAGLQMAAFPRVRDWGYSSTVMTSNITKWIVGSLRESTEETAGEASQAVTFLGILGAFAAGVVATGFAHRYLGAAVVYLAALVLLIALAWLVVTDAEAEDA